MVDDKNSTGERAGFHIRPAVPADRDAVIAVDEAVSGERKTGYWNDLFAEMGGPRPPERYIYVAELNEGRGATRLIGFVLGEARAWEFGSPKCGWLFGIGVDPQARENGIGEALTARILDRFREAGVNTVRTMVARDNHLLMSFFRSEGMRAGPYLQLELDLEGDAGSQ